MAENHQKQVWELAPCCEKHLEAGYYLLGGVATKFPCECGMAFNKRPKVVVVSGMGYCCPACDAPMINASGALSERTPETEEILRRFVRSAEEIREHLKQHTVARRLVARADPVLVPQPC